MNVTVLMENTAKPGLAAEHGLSFYVEYRGRSILLDAGSSGAFAGNARLLGADLAAVEAAVLSHGHYDHADGLRAFFACNAAAPVYIQPSAGDGYYARSDGAPRFVGIHRDLWEGFRDRFVPVQGKTQLFPGVWLVPETVRGGPFASREPNLLRKAGPDDFRPDDFSHEQSLVFETAEGLVAFNSCCHSGAVNIVRGVLDQFPGQQVRALLGGLHMLSPGVNALNCPPEYVGQVARALAGLGVETLWTGHCTGPAAFALLQEELGPRVRPLTAGLALSF